MPPKEIANCPVQLPASGGKKGQNHCVLCAVVAERVCQRCGDSYCSKECQTADWQHHRYICFPMPALVMPRAFSILQCQEELSMDMAGVSKPKSIKVTAAPIAGSTSSSTSTSSCSTAPTISGIGAQMAAADPKTSNPSSPSSVLSNKSASIKTKNKITTLPTVAIPPSNSVVIISGFRSANRCFVRSEYADQAYSQVCEKVNALGNEMPKVKNLRLNGFVLALHNGVFQRGKVMQTRPHKTAKLLFVDQGIIKMREMESMREISDELLALPSFCFLVQLKDVANYTLSNDVMSFLSQLDGEKFVMHHDSVCKNNPINVELVNVKTQKSLNETIREICSTKKVSLFGQKARPKVERTESGVSATSAKVDATPPTVALPQEPLKQPATKSEPIIDLKLTEVTDEPAKIEPKSVEEIVFEVSARAATAATTIVDLLPPAATADTLKPIEVPLPVPKVNGADASNNGPILEPPFEMRRLSVNDKEGIDLYIVDSSNISRGIIGAFDRVFASEFGCLNTTISKISPSKPYKPVLKEYVLAKFENSLYRAKVEQIRQLPQTQQTVYRMTYLDYTNIEEVAEEDIYRYPLAIALPCHTSICMIEDFPYKPNAEQIAYLSAVLKVHEIIHVDAVSYMKNVAWIKCNELIKKLETM
ncbi:uncharacterized protein DMAD_08961 [Drosophila madeirensis]|uniref:MYND-type domain-containing protein n=1 Tax=Drosophila madeirensis TaxID=30013 RepID=A0AAU9EW05_DROMD